ncbi:11776_t:CDS:2 [Acaulospora colombiana]|uniref:11776_t:CDS:1 n=1 Tax=Acaulospora colombiana TaxID=27376 RepID=A0ACA9LDT7_9GLOM|nr:11776_t:CDS:2 [Acaulospora colombiana]
MSYDVSILSPVNFDFPGLDISSIKFGIRHLQTIYLYNQGRVVYSDEINNFLKNLPLICTKIRDLHIYINESGSRLLSNLFSDIITAQQGLYEFEFMGCIDNAGSVISSLSCQGNSLKKLVFTNVEFGNTSLESFTHLKCLESLDINDCFFSEKHDHTLSLAFDKLVELSLVRSSLNSTTIASILKSSGSTLRKLKLDVVTAETLQSSIEHCCGLNHLVITSYMNFSLLFFRWIRKLDDLKILVFYDHSYKEIHTSAFVRSLAESLSATVYHLDLSHLILKPDELSYFLINCKARLKHFVLHCSQESFHTHLIIVTEYAIKRRCLRSLTITYKPNVCFPKVRELECVQTLGELGVQVTTAESTLSLNHHYCNSFFANYRKCPVILVIDQVKYTGQLLLSTQVTDLGLREDHIEEHLHLLEDSTTVQLVIAHHHKQRVTIHQLYQHENLVTAPHLQHDRLTAVHFLHLNEQLGRLPNGSPVRHVSRSPPRNRRSSPDPYRPRRSPRRVARKSTNNNDSKLNDLKNNSHTVTTERIESTMRIGDSSAPDDPSSHARTPSTVKSQASDVNENVPLEDPLPNDDSNVEVKETTPRLPSQSPPPKPSRDPATPEPKLSNITNASTDMIDFIVKCCLRLQLPMVTIALALRAYHNYHNYLSQGKNRWISGYTDHWQFDEELTGLACILLVTKNTDVFKGIRKTLNAGWSLKYPKTPLEDSDKMKETVKIVVSNIKNAIKREKELSRETPYGSASRILKYLIEKSERNINSNYTLYSKLTQDVWAMISNCLYSTKITITYSSDVFATAVIYVTACKIGIDLQAQFSERLVIVTHPVPKTDWNLDLDAIMDIIDFKIVDPFEPSIDQNV